MLKTVSLALYAAVSVRTPPLAPPAPLLVPRAVIALPAPAAAAPAPRLAALTPGVAALVAEAGKDLSAGNAAAGSRSIGRIFGEGRAIASAVPARPATERRRGVVSRWNEVRGYGFITPLGGGEPLYFVAEEVQGPDPADPLRKLLREGDAVDFETETGRNGERAVRIVRR